MIPGAGEREEDLETLDQGELDLLAYLDGELEGDAAAAVEARLRTDRAYAARARAMQAIGDFLRKDADRLYEPARVDAIVDDVLEKVREDRARESRSSVAEVIPMSQVAPPTSRLTRKKKNTVIWVAFGAVTAAAAAMVLWVGTVGTKGVAPVATATAPATTDTVAIVKTAPTPPSNPTVPGPAAIDDDVEVEGLEVGSEATVIYTRTEEKSSPVVWITAREAK